MGPKWPQRLPEDHFRAFLGGPPRSSKSAPGRPWAQNGPRGRQKAVLEPFLEGPLEARNLPLAAHGPKMAPEASSTEMRRIIPLLLHQDYYQYSWPNFVGRFWSEPARTDELYASPLDQKAKLVFLLDRPLPRMRPSFV